MGVLVLSFFFILILYKFFKLGVNIMKKFKKKSLIILMIALMVFVAACGQINVLQDEEEPITLTVSAAASLKDAMEEIKVAYEKQNLNVRIIYNFASSGSLRRQIEQGASVDVFVSAAVKHMDALKKQELIFEDTSKNFLENKIVLIVPKDSSDIMSFEDLLTDRAKNIGMGEPKSVPAGQYAEEVLMKLNIYDSIKNKTVFGKDVKEVLYWVETGNADAGIVYETDARISNKVKIVAKAPVGSHQPVYYPASVIKDSKNVDAAKEYISFLYSSEAKPIFEEYGFVFIEKN